MRLALVLSLCVGSVTWAGGGSRHDDPNEGMEGSIRLGIPEPMIFDLVRPLGAAKGEFEINSLFISPIGRGGRLYWAPEIEYAFGRGTAVEFELPITGVEVESYKFAMQQKLPVRRTRRFTHGLQGIGEVERGREAWDVSSLYILGIRWQERWSTMSMYGAHHRREHGGRRTMPLINNSVFYEKWRYTALGIETNVKGIRDAQSSLLLVPQVHVRLPQQFNLQLGAGYARVPGDRGALLSWRLIREL